MPPRALRNGAARIVLAVQALCFAAGAVNHGRDFLLRGWRPYRFAPHPAFEVYWSALILLDLAVVALVLTGRIRPALLLGPAIMLSDVAINVLATHAMGFTTYGWPLLLQAMFLGFILGSIGFLWTHRRMAAPHYRHSGASAG
jgi:hypothetical protein